MKKLYLLLIFIGIISLVSGEQKPFPERPQPEKCGSTEAVPGCAQCQEVSGAPEQFECKSAAPGYFLNATNDAVACPRACKTCQNENSCDECENQEANGYKDELVGDQKCSECKVGFTKDNGDSIYSLDGICISVASTGQYSCAQDYVWDSTPNQNRKCVSNAQECAAGYATQSGDTSSTEDCVKCADSFTQLSGVAVDGNLNRYKIQTCVKYQAPAQRETEQCTEGGGTSVKGCANCEGAVCKQAEPGYYIKDGQAASCPSQCAECSSESVCTKCLNNIEVDQNKNCGCQDGYVPNIDKSLLSNPINQFICVKYSEGASCAAGYTWNVPAIVPEPSTGQACISIFNETSCYVENPAPKDPEFDQTSYWNAPINPSTEQSRACVLKGQSCLETYATTEGEIENIAADCNSCLNKQAQMQGYIQFQTQFYYYQTVCINPTSLPKRDSAGNCQVGSDDIPTGCKTCDKETGKCTEADLENGYFLDTTSNQAVACPLQCSKCNDASVCTSCSGSAELKDNKCQCTEGYVPSIDTETAAKPGSSFACIKQSQNIDCSEGYTWNSQPLLTTESKAVCISRENNNQCYQDNPPLVVGITQEAYWNSPANPNTVSNRLCVGSGRGSCQVNYADSKNQTQQINSDCSQCSNGLNPIQGYGKDSTGAVYSFIICSPQIPPFSRVVVDCKIGETKTISCAECNAIEGKCKKAADGYFVVPDKVIMRNLAQVNQGEGTVQACPLNCGTCSNSEKCDSCLEGYTKLNADSGVCECSGIYVPNIDKQSAYKSNKNNSFVCVTKQYNQACAQNYTWNTEQILIDQSKAECLLILNQNASCYANIPVEDPNQNNYWNSAFNSDRRCVSATGQQCAQYYAQKPGDPSSNYSTPLTQNCDSCISQYSLSNDLNNQTCIFSPTSSSLLTFGIVVVGILISILF